MKSVMRGVMADGIATSVSGLAGGVGTNTSTPSAGLAAATGVSASRVAYAAGGLFLLLGFLPKLAAVLAIMPRSVIISALLFTVAFILINGLQVMLSRLIDARRTLDHRIVDHRGRGSGSVPVDRRVGAEDHDAGDRLVAGVFDADRALPQPGLSHRRQEDLDGASGAGACRT
jgi:hypothetical protein